MLSVNMDKTLKDALSELAAKNRRILSDYVRITLEDVVKNERAKEIENEANGRQADRLLDKRLRTRRD